MGFNFYLWIEVIIALFLFLLMRFDYRRNREGIFKLLSFVFLFMLVKSFAYQMIRFTDAKWMIDSSTSVLKWIHPSDTLLNPMYAFKNMIMQFMDLIFVIIFSYVLISERKGADGSDVKNVNTHKWIQIIVVFLVGMGIVYFSIASDSTIIIKDVVGQKIIADYQRDRSIKGFKLSQDVTSDFEREIIEPDDYEDDVPADILAELQESGKLSLGMYELLEDDTLVVYYYYHTFESALTKIAILIFSVFIVWKLVMLSLAIKAVVSIYGYIANVLNYISQSKALILFVIGLLIAYAPGSLLVLTSPGWLMIEIIALILYALFALRVHGQYVADIEEQVVDLAKQKDIIIDLMRDISGIVGSGDFELDTVIQHIVDASVKGANNARGGTILMKDPITNRLMVSYVNGLYPPTKAFNIMSGMALTENLIVEKFKSEKIALGDGLIGQVAETGKSVYIPDAVKDEMYVQTLPGTMTVTSFIAVPLKTREEVFGVLSIVHDETSFLESDLSLIETLGEQAAITIQQIQMYQQILDKKQAEKELGVAGEIQGSLVPHTFPETNKYDMYAFSIPAKGVGGDYYDYIDFGSNKLAVTMFDVSGKGVPAALIMVMIRSILRTIASLEEDTKEILTKLNNTISEEIVEDRYATGFYLLFDAERGIMSYTNAGHGPLILYRAKKDEFELLDTDGMPVGIMTGVEYGQDYTTLENGDIAILYTDGITEAMNDTHEEFGMDRTYAIIRNYKRESAREIASKILEEVNRFVGNAPQHDDETLLILKMK